ncbi:hypothetical protein SAMN04490244_106128 [Tranquillimonas rosea]|uniref:Flavoprotein, HI0933 family n=1 Tax=Tranquillimonas rosea TaxID=641238 RepID=A0A1H9UZE2_9RHOB|nr:NAD(P)/FAD-dependent oxidoreductase [Tranquillimonas rosea]SES14900.1 hypothetical protein SAMN04490244_106128 [Tranquillimonas rosea]
MVEKQTWTTLILGAGAAGMMCAAHAGPDVLVIDHAKAPGEKIRISGGGRCNFTNMHAAPDCFISANPHFCKSALSRYTQWDFVDLVGRHGVGWHEKTLGQLFCDRSARDVIAMLRAEMDAAGATLWLRTSVIDVDATPEGFRVSLEREGARVEIHARNLVLATGGKSIPKMGATGLAYRLARQFGLALTDIRPALVPLTFGPEAGFAELSGLSVPARVSAGGTAFDEALLFTHRGLSGPAILQASSYWRDGDGITLDLAPGTDLSARLREMKRAGGKRALHTALADLLPARLAADLARRHGLTGNLADQSDARLAGIAEALSAWHLVPTGSEGYRTAEVTLGGIDTDGLDSRTMAARRVPGLYAIGEAVDVTGWLGGYNFQWAWSSGWAAGQAIAARSST